MAKRTGRTGGRTPRGRAAPSPAARHRAAARALSDLAPLLGALAEAGDLPPVEAARQLRRAVASLLGWRARIVPSPSPLAPEVHARVEAGVALVPVAPGAGALRLSGASDDALRLVAEVAALAFARARAHPLEPGRRLGDGRRPRVLIPNGAAGPGGLDALVGPGFEVVRVACGAAAEAVRVERLDAVLLDLGADATALDALEALRGDPAGADLPALVLGGRADEAARLRAVALDAEFLPPPTSAAELRARLEHLVQQARATRALRDEALTDPLTGLPNRRALEAHLHEELRRARRYRTPLSCVMADLDHLKAINDTLGHAAGDQALQGLAVVLRAELRATDLAARVGGDEFLVLLPHTGAGEAAVLAERVRRRLGTLRLGAGDQARTVGASFGVAELAPDGDGQALVEAADRALYAAKAAGRGVVRLAPGCGDGAAPHAG